MVRNSPQGNLDIDILALIPGKVVAQVLSELPPGEDLVEETRERRFDVPDLGPVVFTFRKSWHKPGKSVLVFWVAERAVRAN